MLKIEETMKKFGYDPEILTPGSDKRVVVSCDYCGVIRDMKNNSRTSALKSGPKDACKNCAGQKRKEILIEKYGVTTTQALPEVRKKTAETNIRKFGSESFFGTDIAKSKIKATNIERYGNEHNMKNPEVRAKRDKTIKKKYGVDNVFKLKEMQDLAIESRIKNGSIKIFNGKTMGDLAIEHGYAYSSMVERINKLGYDIATFAKKRQSSLEVSMSKLLTSIGVEFTQQYKVDTCVADFKVNDFNLLIEADGLYWHSDFGKKDDLYHINKLGVYTTAGYRCLFFREDEIRDKQNIVQSIILNSLNMCGNRYYARKLKIAEVDFRTAIEFIKVNHLMGPTSAVSCSFGLYSGDDLVAILQMKRTKDNIYDIARFCTSLNTSIVGGFSRLLKTFIRSKSPDKISTFIDLRYGTGDYLSQFGFEEKTCYKSFKWTNGQDTYHRLKFPGSSGYEKGLCKIWDCGQKKFVLNLC